MRERVESAARPQSAANREVIVRFSPEELKAPFILRCGAALVDYILIIAVPVLGLLVPAFGSSPSTAAGGSPSTTQWLFIALIYVSNFLLLPLMNGQTVGKMLTGLTVVDLDGRVPTPGTIVLRNTLGYMLTFLTLGIGFMMSAVGRRGRALHDYVAGTMVVFANRRIL